MYLIAVSTVRLNYLQKERIGNILNVNEKKRYQEGISKSGKKKKKKNTKSATKKRIKLCVYEP